MPVHQEIYKGYEVKIHVDEIQYDPRKETGCNFGHMICFHNRYDLGDEHNFTPQSLQKLISKPNIISLPLYLYDHSGITIRTYPFSCPWDSGQVGYIYVNKKEIQKALGYYGKIDVERIEIARKMLIDEVKAYDMYLKGDVYGYVIKDALGEDVESCWGFVGEWEDCLEEAKNVVNSITKKWKEKQ